MADTKISALSAVTDVQATDEYVLARAGSSYKIDASDLLGGGGLIFDHTVSVAGTTLDSNTILGGSIAGTYRNLRMTVVARSDRAASTSDFFYARFNNDSGSNYDTQYYQIDNTGALAQAKVTGTAGIGNSSAPLGLVPAASSAAGLAGAYEMSVPGYAATTFNKQLISEGVGNLDTADIRTWNARGQWRSTAAVTRVQLLMVNANFLAGSRWILKGD